MDYSLAQLVRQVDPSGDRLPLLSGYRYIAAVSDQRLDHVLTPDSMIRI